MDYETKDGAFELLYLKERKKAQAFMTASIILAVLLAGSVAYSLSNSHAPQTTGGPNAHGGPVMMGSGGGSGGKVIMPEGKASDFLNADGTVNETLIQESVDSKQAPAQMLQAMLQARERQIDDELATGGITSQQASELKEAWRNAVGGSDAN